jgi:two-component system, sensor histidine kinase and response regulator
VSFQSQLQHLDRSVALARMDGDEQLLQEIARVFMDDYPKVLSQVRAAVAAGDAVLLERSAHTLKGSVANFGAAQAVAAAYELEIMGRRHELANCRQGLDKLERALEGLRPELMQLVEVA